MQFQGKLTFMPPYLRLSLDIARYLQLLLVDNSKLVLCNATVYK